jgi:oxygen-independent coproporphyrinogen-3 oxidase
VYCDFLSVPYDETIANSYTDALCRELELKKGLSSGLKAVFIGGGTPSVLPEKYIARIFSCIRANYTLAPDTEITVEANPGTLTQSGVAALPSMPVNRLSLGIQSFHDRELKSLGRIHTAQEAIHSAKMVCASGIKNLSIDLIYGIPGQAIDSWRHSLATAVSLGPKHISAYELTPEKGTALQQMLDTNALTLPSEDNVLEMQDLAVTYLAASGYEHYEISSYALPGYRCIHNLNYWGRGEYIGTGAGAHSFMKGVRSENTRDIREYITRLGKHEIPEAGATEILSEDALKEFIFLGLRKMEGIRLSSAYELGLNIPKAATELIQEGFAQISDSHFRFSAKGLLISNTLIAKLLQNLGL